MEEMSQIVYIKRGKMYTFFFFEKNYSAALQCSIIHFKKCK
jgi:hypothetical protein